MAFVWCVTLLIIAYYFLKFTLKILAKVFREIYKIILVNVESKRRNNLSKDIKSKDITLRLVAEKVLDLDKSADSWGIILDYPRAFLFSGSDEPKFTWNWTGEKYNFPKVNEEHSNKEVYLKFMEKTVRVNYVYDRSDGVRGMLALSELVGDLYEIRYCVDSWHSSDLAYIALPIKDWKELETKFDSTGLSYRFMPLPTIYEEFESNAFTEENSRNYK